MFMYDADLNFPLLSFGYDKEKRTIRIRIPNPYFHRGPRKDVVGFRFRYDVNIHVEGIKGIVASEWFERKNLKRLIRREIQRIFEQDMRPEKWFPETERYELESNAFVFGASSGRIIDLCVWAMLTVHFSKEVPFEEFEENFWDFFRELLTERGFSGKIVRMVKQLVTQAFPEASVTATTGWNAYQFYFSDGSVSDNRLGMFAEIFIKLIKPLPEEVLRLLLNSKSERDFILEFLMLVTPSDVESVFISDPVMRETDLGEVSDLLSKVSSMVQS